MELNFKQDTNAVKQRQDDILHRYALDSSNDDKLVLQEQSSIQVQLSKIETLLNNKDKTINTSLKNIELGTVDSCSNNEDVKVVRKRKVIGFSTSDKHNAGNVLNEGGLSTKEGVNIVGYPLASRSSEDTEDTNNDNYSVEIPLQEDTCIGDKNNSELASSYVAQESSEFGDEENENYSVSVDLSNTSNMGFVDNSKSAYNEDNEDYSVSVPLSDNEDNEDYSVSVPLSDNEDNEDYSVSVPLSDNGDNEDYNINETVENNDYIFTGEEHTSSSMRTPSINSIIQKPKVLSTEENSLEGEEKGLWESYDDSKSLTEVEEVESNDSNVTSGIDLRDVERKQFEKAEKSASSKVNDEVYYVPGIGLTEFLKRNKNVRTKEELKKYFSEDVILEADELGAIIIKKGKIIF